MVYWLLTKGPCGVAAGTILHSRPFDRLGPVAVPPGARVDTVGAIVHGVYEYPERTLIRRWLPSNLNCVELGCSIGIISRVILSKLQPACRLIAVEASQELLDLAKRNIDSAGFLHRSLPIHGAVHYDGDSVVFTNNADHIRGKVAASRHSFGTKTPCVTLKQIIRENNLGDFSLVMDIEGSEFDLIERDSESLAGCQAIIAEVHGDENTKKDFTTRVRNYGFTLAEAKHSVCAYLRHPQDQG
jgi:FkbM family methyltransferase